MNVQIIITHHKMHKGMRIDLNGSVVDRELRDLDLSL